jgi:ElaB/YqjD/DUF883 family membrane-anchored ribosome-binding protein
MKKKEVSKGVLDRIDESVRNGKKRIDKIHALKKKKKDAVYKHASYIEEHKFHKPV